MVSQLEILDKKYNQLLKKLDNEESQKNQSEKQLEELTISIEQLQEHKTNVGNQLSKSSFLVEKLTQYESLQEKFKHCEQQLSLFPSNLEQLIQEAEEQNTELKEIEKTLPWLTELAEYRLKLADVLKEEQTAITNLESLDKQIKEHENNLQKLNLYLETVQKNEKNLSQEVASAKTRYDDICQRKTRFEEASHQPTCELCGQEITPEHAQKEKQRLEQQITAAKTLLDNLQFEHEQVKNSLTEIIKDRDELQSVIKGLGKQFSETQNQQQQAQQSIKNCLNQLNKAYAQLSSSYQTLVNPYIPNTNLEWLNTTYPTQLNLEQLNQAVSFVQKNTNKLKTLQQELKEQNQLENEQQIYSKQLKEIEKTFSLFEAQQARIHKPKLEQEQKQLDLQLQDLKEEQKQVKTQVDEINQTIEQFSKELQPCQTELGKNKVIQAEIQGILQTNIDNLPLHWQEKAITIDFDNLEELISQHQELSEYENLAQRLSDARQSVSHIEEQINTLQTQIEELPQEVQRPANEIEEKLENTKAQRKKVDENRRTAEIALKQLQKRCEERQQLEQDLQQVEGECHLYKLLSDLLGKKGIQLHLLRRAERSIVEIANQILHNLSRGQMKLELRGEGQKSEDQSDKALDLVAYNYNTGERPTAVALTSGSQRFRIAVSLALAIGQYAGQGTRQIKSVIIDEGFGSLDKNGRDDMIQELNELRQQLERIILVSHQEEFFSAFTNGYAVELVNGASRVSLIEPA